MITVEYDGVSCHFDSSRLDPQRPGSIWTPLLAGHFYEEAMLGYIRSLNIPGCYVDVGSNIGTHALFFAVVCPATVVYAFEPRESFYEQLVRNVELNGAAGRVVASRLALADRAGQVSTTMMGREFTFEARRLDDVVQHPVGVMKLDVEGMETAVLAGASRVLSKDRPVLFAEAGTEQEFAALRACLHEFDYRPTGRVWNATPTHEFVPRSSLIYSVPGVRHGSVRAVLRRARAVRRAVARRRQALRG